MAIIGLLLILGAGVITAGAIYDGGESATIEVFGLSADTTIGGVFVVGLFTMLIFFLGIWMLFASMGRSRRKRQERKEARNRQRQSVSEIEDERAKLRAENERLNEQLHRSRGSGGAATGTAAGTTAGAAAAHDHGSGRSDRTTSDGMRTDDRRPEHVEGDRVVDHTTDLTSREEHATSTSGRHRDQV